jgi:hypothetical protein
MTETLVGVNPPSSKDPADPPSIEELAAAKELVRQARAQGVALTGPGGLLKALTKTVIETALEEEMAEHLGYDKHDPLGRNRGNSRNGKRAKTVLTDSGEVAIEVPQDREGSFEPVIVAKRQRRPSSCQPHRRTTPDLPRRLRPPRGAGGRRASVPVTSHSRTWTSHCCGQ